MTTEEINAIMDTSIGKMTHWQCKIIINYMMGYVRHATDIDLVRNEFFRQHQSSNRRKGAPGMALILIITGALCATIGYFAGHSHGYELGREHELDKAAQRHERMKRFSNFN
jgi:hypothetical protein